jgi:hypothetical protein
MKQRRRIYYSAAQRAEIWDRWQAGESMSSIGRRFDRESALAVDRLRPNTRPMKSAKAQKVGQTAPKPEVDKSWSVRTRVRPVRPWRGLGSVPNRV